MKAMTIALLLGCGGAAFAQRPAPAVPSPGMPDPHQIFKLPPGLDSSKPQFKFQFPDGKRSLPLRQLPLFSPPQPNVDIDPGILRRPPQGFVQQTPRPALPHNLYPDLKILPVEIARLDPPPARWPELRALPIPRTWPKAKVEPIPRTWENYRLSPVAGMGTVAPARK